MEVGARFRVGFISPEKLGVMASWIERLGGRPSKRQRASDVQFIDKTLKRLGLIPDGCEWTTRAVTLGADFTGNYGVFIIQERNPNAKEARQETPS